MNQLLSWSIPSHLVLFTVYLSMYLLWTKFNLHICICIAQVQIHPPLLFSCYTLHRCIHTPGYFCVCLSDLSRMHISFVCTEFCNNFVFLILTGCCARYLHVFWCRNKGLYVVSSVGLSLSLLMFNNISALDLLVTQAKPRIASTKRYFFQSTPASAVLFFPSSLI